MAENTQSYYDSCLHCASTQARIKLERFLGHEVHTDRLNEILHLNFIYAGASVEGPSYTLMMKYNASSFTWLHRTEDAQAYSAAEELFKWFATFRVVNTWQSVRGTHFKKQLMQSLNKSLHVTHHFTALIAPQANSTVDRAGRELLHTCKVFVSELRIKEKHWIALITNLQTVLNHTIRATVEYRALITSFTGLAMDNSLNQIVIPKMEGTKTFGKIKAPFVIQKERILDALENINKDIYERHMKAMEDAVRRHNQRTHVQQANFRNGICSRCKTQETRRQ